MAVSRSAANPPGRRSLRESSLPAACVDSSAARPTLSPEDAVQLLRENNDGEYQRYMAARAVRALRESDDEKPASGTLRQLTRQAGGLGRWRRGRPALLRAIGPPRDPELPDDLQSPLPPHSRWVLDMRANVLFNVFTRATNPVEDFFLVPQDDVWRSHRYGVYGLRYERYPNPGTAAVPRDSAGLYYRPNRKILKETDSARPARRPGVVTLEHVKRVASRAVGQFFPLVHANPMFFDAWPRIDDVLGCAIEYFHHYFELRRLEETMAQLECQLYDSGQLEARRRRMDECVGEWGRVYSTYLLGFGLPFHHLQQGAGYKSAAASERQIFEALNAFVAQCVWIVYRRPNVTVIARELGRLFRTAGFDPSRRAPPPPVDDPPPVRTDGVQNPPAAGSHAASVGQTDRRRSQGTGTVGQAGSGGRQGASERRLGAGETRGASGRQSVSSGRQTGSNGRQTGSNGRQTGSNGGQTGSKGRETAGESVGRRGTGVGWQQRASTGQSGSGQRQVTPGSQPAISGSRPAPDGQSPANRPQETPSSLPGFSPGPATPAGGPDTHQESTPPVSPAPDTHQESTPPVSPAADGQQGPGDISPSPSPQSPSPSVAAGLSAAGGGGGGEGGSAASARSQRATSTAGKRTDGGPAAPGAAHVSMKKVYGLYTGPPPPQCAIFGLLRATSPLLRQSLGRRRQPDAAPPEDRLRVDHSHVGILGTPLQNYDDVLAAIDYEREVKQKQLQFLGPSSTRAGVSRVAGVIPYLLLPSKFFSPDA